jgi:hypothetical protein
VSSCLGNRGGLVAEQRFTFTPTQRPCKFDKKVQIPMTRRDRTELRCTPTHFLTFHMHVDVVKPCGCCEHPRFTVTVQECELDCGPWMMDASCRPLSRYCNCAHSLARQTDPARLVLRMCIHSLTVAWSLIQYQDSDTRILGNAAMNSTRVRLPYAR